MTSHIEFEGSSEQEAIEKAGRAMEQPSEQLDYTVVDEGSAGVFGIGARPVRIRVRVPDGVDPEAVAQRAAEEVPASDGSGDEPDEDADSDASSGASEGGDGDDGESTVYGPAPEKAAKAEEVGRELLERMGVACRVSVRDEDREIVVVVEEAEGQSDVAEILGKSRPPAVPALQFLLNKIVNRFPDDRKHIVVEAPSIPKRAARSAEVPEKVAPDAPFPTVESLQSQVDEELDGDLVALAHELASKALELNRVITVHPMLAADRRAVHQSVTLLPGVRTISEGDGLYRRMHIVPEKLIEGDGGAKRKRRRRRRRPGRGSQDEPSAES